MTSSEDRPPPAAPPEPREPDWDRLADGRPWRVKRGRDFDYSVRRFQVEAKLIGRERGQTARFARDILDARQYVWVQFADGDVLVGRPCPRCGGEHLAQLSGVFARCRTCRALLAIERPPDLEEVELRMREASHGAEEEQDSLAAYSGVHLSLAEADTSSERFVGYGFDELGRFTLLYVVAPLAGGERIPDDSTSAGFLHTIPLAVQEPFGDLVDFSRLMQTNLETWDISIP